MDGNNSDTGKRNLDIRKAGGRISRWVFGALRFVLTVLSLGIVAYVIPGDAVTVEDCSYYGEISNGATAQLGIMGGIIGRNDATTAEIKGTSRYGGKIDGQTISTDNVTSLAAAHNDKAPNATVSPKLKPVTVTSVSLWNGN